MERTKQIKGLSELSQMKPEKETQTEEKDYWRKTTEAKTLQTQIWFPVTAGLQNAGS